jgi:hypothetical protein
MTHLSSKRLLICLVTLLINYGLNPVLIQAQKLSSISSSPAQLRLNQHFYSDGDLISAELFLNHNKVPVLHPFVVLVSPKTGDAEGLQLKNVSDVQLRTVGALKISANASKKENDGVLAVSAGEVIVAYYYNNKLEAKKVQQNTPDIVSDCAFIRGNQNYQANLLVNKAFAISPDEASFNASTIAVQGQVPVQIANNQVLFYASSEPQVKQFLEYSGGKLLSRLGTNNGKPMPAVLLVEINVKTQNLNDLGQYRQFLGYQQRAMASNEEAFKLIHFCNMASLDGFAVTPNPRMRYTSEEKDPPIFSQPIMANPPGTGESIPRSFTENLTNVPKVWNYMAIWDRDAPGVRVGIIDHGFDPNTDYQNVGTITQCEASLGGVRCGAGVALGAPTVGGSLVGRRSWHGNAVQARSCGILNNGFGSAGVGGQVGIPMIIKMTGADAYAFNIGGAIIAAVNNGAEVINISGGYPCRALTSLGDFSFCDPGTRTAICAALFPVVQAGAIIACSALGAIPFAGPFLVGPCIGAASTAYISACVAQIALGNPGEIIGQAVQFAKSMGVPVVASAGNIIRPEHIPAELRPFVNLDENRMTVEEWGVVPAGLPDVVCVGAAEPGSPFGNSEVFGRRVDVWAPKDGDYVAPTDGTRPAGPTNPPILHRDFNGTSSAAPFITGLITAAMAVNPQLRRSTSSRRNTIVDEIRRMLSATATPASSLPADPSGRRRNLVNPIAFLKAAAAAEGATLPVFPSSVYGDDWNIEPTENTNDVITSPNILNYTSTGLIRQGSIVSIPGSGGASNIVDIDRFQIRTTAAFVPASGERFLIRLRTPIGTRFGRLTIRGADWRFLRTEAVNPNEEEQIFEGPAMRRGENSVNFSVEGFTPGDDNIYLVRVGNIMAPPPVTRSVVALSNFETLCPTNLVRGDREFGGGPMINIRINLVITPDQSGIDAVITFEAAEVGADQSTVTGEFRQRVFTTSASNRIVNIVGARSAAVTNFRGAGAGWELSPFGCNEGVVQEAPFTGEFVQRIVVVGDSGGDDIAIPGSDCRCDAKIKSITFNTLTIETTPR